MPRKSFCTGCKFWQRSRYNPDFYDGYNMCFKLETFDYHKRKRLCNGRLKENKDENSNR